jgi:spore germination protein
VPSKKIIAIVIAAALAVAGGATAIAVGSAEADSAPLAVSGYADALTSHAEILKSSPAMSTVVVDGVNLTADGSGITKVSPDALASLETAHQLGKRAELVIGNFDETIGDFSPAIARALLGSEDNIDAVVSALDTEVKLHGWDGVTVDIESISKADASGLTSFVRELSDELAETKSVAVCIQATTGSYGDLGYQLATLAKHSDRLVLMAYDQHGPWSEPGAIGGSAWVTKALAPVLAKVRASKVDLGIAGYGYTWPADGTVGRQLSDSDARALVAADGATPKWSKKQKEWHATLSNGTVLWWSDRRSYAARYAIARSLHLHGVSLWNLSLSDRIHVQ